MVAVSRRGVLFVAGSGGSVPNVLRSTDEGRHWTTLRVPALKNGDMGTAHGYLHVDPRTDRLYYLTSLSVASCAGSGGASVLGPGSVLSWTDDLGTTWNGNTVSCDTYDWGRVVTGPAPKGNAYPSAVYFLGVGQRPVGGQRPVSRSLDGGKTFVRMKNIASATTESGAGVSAPDGTIYFDYPEFLGLDPTRVVDTTYPFNPANTCRSMVAVSEDFGVTWTQRPIPGSLACFSIYGQQRVAVDTAGTVYALWTEDTDGQLYMVTSRDKGRTWSAKVNVTPAGSTFNNSMANIVAGVPGHVFIGSQNTSAAVNPRIGPNQGVGDWHTNITESYNANTASPTFSSVTLDPAEDPTYTTNESPSEGENYLAMNPAGEAWTVFTRHTVGQAGQGQGRTWVARFERSTPVNAPTPTRPVTVAAPAVGSAEANLPATGLGATGPALALVVLGSAAVLSRPRAVRHARPYRGTTSGR